MNELFDVVRNIVETGGPVVAILLLASLFALTIIIVKLVQFWNADLGQTKQVRKAVQQWKAGNRAQALEFLNSKRGIVAQITRFSFENMHAAGDDKKYIEAAVETIATARLHELQSGLRALDTIAQLSPLLGLFGTVLGMIDAFQALQGAGSSVDPSILAGGIWVALLTTAVGLGVAMPVALILSYFETKLENERVGVETAFGELINPLILSDLNETHDNLTVMAHAN